jgi:hypothetical protein
MSISRALVTLLATAALACAEAPTDPGPLIATSTADGRKTATGGGSLVADVVIGDSGLDAADPSVHQSTCPAADTKQWHANFGHSECLIVSPAWVSTTYAPYALTDDVKLIVTREKGKNGRITHVTLLAQDVIGDAGIQHETDPIPVAVPVVPSTAGFTLHVHAVGVSVWRLSGHTGGERVEVIGTIAIGDVVYRP